MMEVRKSSQLEKGRSRMTSARVSFFYEGMVLLAQATGSDQILRTASFVSTRLSGRRRLYS
jgi:hypothetical protein